MKKIITAVNDWFGSIYANLLYRVQRTNWWQKYLDKKWNQEWDELKASFLQSLDVPDEWRDCANTLISNQIEYLRQNQLASRVKGQNGSPFTKEISLLLIATLHLVKKLYTLSKVVGIQPMQGPVGLVYLLEYVLRDGDPSSIALEVIRSTVEAKTRKLQAAYNTEAFQDLASVHGLDVEHEMGMLIGSVVCDEIVAEVLSDLLKAATSAELMEGASTDDCFRLLLETNKAANNIARTTRRGAGNFVIVSPETLTSLASHPLIKIVSYDSNYASEIGSSLMFAGRLNGIYDVYVSPLPQFTKTLLVGYKGKNGAVDAGYIYAPYVPVMASGVVIDPMTFSPQVTMMTRYGKHLASPTDRRNTDIANYYVTIDLTNFDLHR